MKISVIMTVKNGQEYIDKSLKSIVDQTYPVHDIVIVDDGSIDNTLLVLSEIKKTVRNLKVIETGGIGRAKALNSAIENSVGEWIANLDVDDLWHPDKLKLQVNEVKNNESVQLLATESEIIYGSDMPSFECITGSKVISLNARSFFTGNKVNHSSILIRKTLLDDVKGYNEGLNKQIDLDLWYRILDKRVEIHKLLSPLTFKRLHKAQSYENKNRIRYVVHSFKLTFMFMLKNKAPVKYYLYNILRFAYHFLPAFLRNSLRSSMK